MTSNNRSPEEIEREIERERACERIDRAARRGGDRRPRQRAASGSAGHERD